MQCAYRLGLIEVGKFSDMIHVHLMESYIYIYAVGKKKLRRRGEEGEAERQRGRESDAPKCAPRKQM